MAKPSKRVKVPKHPILDDPRVAFVCSDCAAKHGGTWPAEHVATVHSAACDFCGKTATLAHYTDWDWSKRPEIAGGREF